MNFINIVDFLQQQSSALTHKKVRGEEILFGSNSEGKSNQRYSFNVNQRTWFDHVTQNGGGIIDALMYFCGMTSKEAATWVTQNRCGDLIKKDWSEEFQSSHKEPAATQGSDTSPQIVVNVDPGDGFESHSITKQFKRGASPATSPLDHPYLIKKRVTEAEWSKLSVPVQIGTYRSEDKEYPAIYLMGISVDGTPAGLEAIYINDDGEKQVRETKGVGWFQPVHTPDNSTEIVVAEGFINALRVAQLTRPKQTVVNAFSSAGLLEVCRNFRNRGKKVVAAVDVDNGKVKNIDQLKALGCTIVKPPLYGRDSMDWDDCILELGVEIARPAFEKQLEREHFMGIASLLTQSKNVSWLVENVIGVGQTVAFFAQYGQGKTFVAIDLVGSLLIGQQWAGFNVKPGARVLYLCAEGHFGFGKRWEAYLRQKSVELGVSLESLTSDIDSRSAFRVNDTPIKLNAEHKSYQFLIDELDDMATKGTTPDLVVVDTLAKSFVGNENSSEDMGDFLSIVDELKSTYQCSFLIVHHSGKSLTAGQYLGRGSTSLENDCDNTFSLKKSDRLITIKNQKIKEASQLADIHFILSGYPLPCGFNSATLERYEGPQSNVHDFPTPKMDLSDADSEVLAVIRQQHGAQLGNVRAGTDPLDVIVNEKSIRAAIRESQLTYFLRQDGQIQYPTLDRSLCNLVELGLIERGPKKDIRLLAVKF